MYYRTLYVLKGREDPSEHVKTNCVESPLGTLICNSTKLKMHLNLMLISQPFWHKFYNLFLHNLAKYIAFKAMNEMHSMAHYL